MSRQRSLEVIRQAEYVTIGELVRLTGVRYSTLKFYTEEGLLPFEQAEENLTRRYRRQESLSASRPSAPSGRRAGPCRRSRRCCAPPGAGASSPRSPGDPSPSSKQRQGSPLPLLFSRAPGEPGVFSSQLVIS